VTLDDEADDERTGDTGVSGTEVRVGDAASEPRELPQRPQKRSSSGTGA
jgi:hypothetical protein